MEILFWLVPAAVTTCVAMVAVAWWGREGRGEVDRETAARRLGEALTRERGARPGYAVAPREADRASGVALRPSRMRPVVLPGERTDEASAESPVELIGESAGESTVQAPVSDDTTARDRRAS